MRFVSRDPHSTLFLTDNALVMALTGEATGAASSMRSRFEGARRSSRVEGAGNATSYLRGHDNPAAWRTGIAGYPSVRYTARLPRRRLVLYGTNVRSSSTSSWRTRESRGDPPPCRRGHTLDRGRSDRDTSGAGDALSPGHLSGRAPRTPPNRWRLRAAGGRRTSDCSRPLRSNAPLVINPVLHLLNVSRWQRLGLRERDLARIPPVCGYTASLDFPTTMRPLPTTRLLRRSVRTARSRGRAAGDFENCETLAVESDGAVRSRARRPPTFPVVGGAPAALNER